MRPPGVVIIAGLLAFESLGLLAIAVWYINGLLTSTPLSVGGAVFIVVFLLLLAGWLAAVARALLRGFRWPRSAALVFQLFLVILSMSLFSTGAVLGGLVMVIPGAIVLLLLFTPRVLAYTVRTVDSGRAL